MDDSLQLKYFLKACQQKIWNHFAQNVFPRWETHPERINVLKTMSASDLSKRRMKPDASRKEVPKSASAKAAASKKALKGGKKNKGEWGTCSSCGSFGSKHQALLRGILQNIWFQNDFQLASNQS